MQRSILIVDDDFEDVEIVSDALREIDPEIKIIVAENGLRALDYLMISDDDLCLIVLDLNMPYLDGKQTFHKIKENPQFQKVPILIFTSSENPADKIMFKQLGINFITKPHTLADLNRAASVMLEYCI